MRRTVVIGISGAGKTTVARKLAGLMAAPHIELDSIFHQEGWDSLSPEEFAAAVDPLLATPTWVVDGNYTSQGMADLVWPLADTVVWLDPPRRVVMYRVISRTLLRMATREKLWGKVTEPWTNLYKLDPAENIIVWAWTRFASTRERYERCLVDGAWDTAIVHRLRSRRDLTSFFAEAGRTS